MKVLGTVLVALTLLATACDSTNRGIDEAANISITPGPTLAAVEPSATAAPSATARARSSASTGGATQQQATTSDGAPVAVDAIRSPIKIGLLATAVSNAGDAGVSLAEVQTLSDRQIFDALIKDFNSKGGLAGRKIEPIFAHTDTGSASWEGDFAAACATFTQDNKVAAVIGYNFAFFDSFETCLHKAGVPHLSTAYATPDRVTLARYPGLFGLINPDAEHRELTKIDNAIKDGVLTPSSKIGVFIDQCPITQRPWKNTIEPHIKAKGLKITSYAAVSCSGGANDNSVVVNDMTNAILKFRSDGVDTVLMMAEGSAFLLFGVAAEGQVWRPKYVVSSLSGPAALGEFMPKNQLRNTFGYGWLPSGDVLPGQHDAPTPNAKRCLDKLAALGLRPEKPLDYHGVYNSCDAFFIFEKVLQITKGRTSIGEVKGAMESLGTSYVSASTVGGKTSFSPTRHDGPAAVRAIRFDTSCNCFVYSGPLRPMG